MLSADIRTEFIKSRLARLVGIFSLPGKNEDQSYKRSHVQTLSRSKLVDRSHKRGRMSIMLWLSFQVMCYFFDNQHL